MLFRSDAFEFVMGLDMNTADDYSYVAFDNLLADWDQNLSQLFTDHPENRKEDSPCGTFSDIKRFGAASVAEWLYVAVELNEVPTTDQEIQIVVFLTDPASKQYQVIAPFDLRYYVIKNSDNELIRPVRMLSKFDRTELELAVNASWLGWSEYPSGTVLRIATFAGNSQCDYTSEFTATGVVF